MSGCSTSSKKRTASVADLDEMDESKSSETNTKVGDATKFDSKKFDVVTIKVRFIFHFSNFVKICFNAFQFSDL